MAAATIIHHGTDEGHRVAMLKTAGYIINNCDSFAQLHSALMAIPPVDAEAIAECRDEPCEKAISLSRAASAVPLILFQSAIPQFNESNFDLVVPALTPPQVWVDEVKRVIEESRNLRTYSARNSPARRGSAQATVRFAASESAAVREKSRREGERSKTEVARKPLE
jgi:hypothetical protein